jgi:DNA-binding NarL/FixJ family response regulator
MDGAMRGARSETTRHDKSDLNPLRSLTTKQIETLRLIGEGLTNEQIASVRGITLRAAEVMVSKTLKLVGIDETAGNRRVLATRKLF